MFVNLISMSVSLKRGVKVQLGFENNRAVFSVSSEPRILYRGLFVLISRGIRLWRPQEPCSEAGDVRASKVNLRIVVSVFRMFM